MKSQLKSHDFEVLYKEIMSCQPLAAALLYTDEIAWMNNIT